MAGERVGIMETLLVKCPHCKYENDLGEKGAKIYKSSFAFTLNRKCVKCELYFDETDTHETDYRIIDKQKEMIDWLNLLLKYATGKKKWDTGGIWVCESHSCTPFEQGTTFDCPCGGPGMPPFRY